MLECAKIFLRIQTTNFGESYFAVFSGRRMYQTQIRCYHKHHVAKYYASGSKFYVNIIDTEEAGPRLDIRKDVFP